MEQKLHEWQVLTDTNGKLDYMSVDSEDDELTEELFNSIQKFVNFDAKIVSIYRVN